MPAKNVKDVMVTFNPPALLARLDRFCDARHLKRSGVIMIAVERYLAASTATEPTPQTGGSVQKALTPKRVRA